MVTEDGTSGTETHEPSQTGERTETREAPVGDADTLDARGVREPAAEPVTGERVGRYVIDARIGAGGMGVVHRAHDPELGRTVAIKFLHAERRFSRARRERLRREAQAMARLSHPNVVTVYDVGSFAGQLFLAMEHIAGCTLRAWLAEPRSWREIVKVLVAAGEGVAAAHGAGIVHRDFKPDNVLVDAHGRPRVTDFGLARAAGEADTGADAPPDPSPALTLTGSVVGTPRYMAPEQHRGEPADVRSDQFSFCVTLYEALYGQPPFPGDTISSLAAAVTEGAIRPPPRGSRVPRWVHAVVTRGLAVDPAERFTDMAALLAALRADPGARRRRLALAGGVAALLAAGAALVVTRPDGPRCDAAHEHLRGVWDADARAAARAAFAETGLPYAAGSFEAAAARLDRYTAGWQAMRQDACAATHERGEQSDALLDLRMRCLDRRLEGVRALTTRLRAPDPEIIAAAPEMVGALAPVATCADVENLTAVQPLPGDAAGRARVAQGRALLDEVAALRAAGKEDAARGLLDQAHVLADASAYAPLIGEVALARGELLARQGDAAGARKALQAAIDSAAAARDARLEADAWLALVGVTADSTRNQAAVDQTLSAARAAVARVGDDPDLETRLAATRGEALLARGDLAGALAGFAERLAHLRETRGEQAPELALAHRVYGGVLANAGRLDEASEHLERALALTRARVGDEHPDIAATLTVRAHIHRARGEMARATGDLERALAILEATYGPDDRRLVNPLKILGGIHAGRRDDAAAMAALERARAILEPRVEPGDPRLEALLNSIGRAHALARRFEEARAHFARAVEGRVAAGGAPDEALAIGLLNLGMLSTNMGDDRAARDYCGRGLAVLDELTGGVGSHMAGKARVCVAAAALNLGEVDEARAHFEAALAIFAEQKAGPGEVSQASLGYAQALWRQGHVDEALARARQARELASGQQGLERVARAADDWLREVARRR